MSSFCKRRRTNSVSNILEVENTVNVQVRFEEVTLIKKDTPEKVKSLEIRIPACEEPSESVLPKKSNKSGIDFDLKSHNVTFDVLFDKSRPVEFEIEIIHKDKGPIVISKFNLRLTDVISKKTIRREVSPTYPKMQKIKLR